MEDTLKLGARVEKIDGVSMFFDDWNFNIRSSNTEPLIRLNLEAKSKKLLDEKLKLVIELIS